MNIDWSKAPEDATHAGNSPYEKGVITWFKGISDPASRNYFMNEGSMNAWAISSENLSAWDLIVRPKKQDSWYGEGLPPVGTECEWKEKSGFQWVAATILFITESSVVCKRSDGFEWQMPTKRTVFRPIKTAEQLAEEEKVAAIAEMRDVLMAASDRKSVTLVECLATVALYEAGYRKQ